MICDLCNGEGLVKNLICGQCLGKGKIMEENEEVKVEEEVVEAPAEEVAEEVLPE